MANLTLFHVENERPWRETVMNLLTHGQFNELEYRAINDSLDQAILKLKTNADPAIIIFDLQLNGTDSEYKTIFNIIESMSYFQDNHFEVFILSALLTPRISKVLFENKIKVEHIFDKNSFKQEEFLSQIQIAIGQLKRNQREHPEAIYPPTLLEILKAMNKLNTEVDQGIDDLKRGQAAIYRKINSDNRMIIEKILQYLRNGEIQQATMNKTVDAIRRALKFHIQDVETHSESEINLLKAINDSLNRSINISDKFELSIPIIPFLLNFRTDITAHVDLEAAWNDLIDIFSQRN